MELLALALALFLPFAIVALVIYALVQYVKRGSKRTAITLPDLFYWTLGIAVLGFNIFAYEADPGIGWGIFTALLCVGLVLSFKKEQRTPLVYVLAGLGIVAALLFGFRANGFVQAVNALTVVLVIAKLFILRSIDQPRWNILWLAKAKCQFFVRSVGHVFDFMYSAARLHKSRHPLLLTITKTIIVTLVVLTVFLIILSQADPVFEQAVRTFREQMIGRTILSVLLILGLAYLLSLPIERDDKPTPRFTFLGFLEVAIPLGSLILLLGFFLSIQQQYLFGDHANFQVLDITYAEYVRKGFIELIVAALVGGFLSYAVALKDETLTDTRQKAVLKVLNAILILALGLILLSALKRDWMYIEMYGLTRVRIVGEVFLVWVAGILLLIGVYAIITSLQEKFVLGGAILLSAGVVVYLNACNMDAKIAAAVPPRNQPVDVFYLSLLSPDAIEGWERVIRETGTLYGNILPKTSLTEAEMQQLADSVLALDVLRERIDYLMPYKIDPYLPERDPLRNRYAWQEFNYSREQAYEHVIAHPALFDAQLTCLQQELADLQVARRYDLAAMQSARLWDYEYPFLSAPSYNVYPRGPDELTYAYEDTDLRSSRARNGRPEPCPVL